MITRPIIGSITQPILRNPFSKGGAGYTIPYPQAGLLLWLDAADTSTITKSGDEVSVWKDKSGNEYNATKYGGVTGPDSGTRSFNGRNVLDFAPTDLMSLDAYVAELDLTDGEHTIVSVSASDSTSQAGLVVGAEVIGGGGQDRFYHGYAGGTATVWAYSGSFIQQAFKDFQPRIITGTRSTTEVRGYSAGEEMNNSPQNLTGNVDIANVTIGGVNATGGNDLDGWIGEIIIYDRVLSTAELYAVHSALKVKWGIALPEDDYSVIVLAGQSNMIGFNGDGTVEGPNVYIYETDRNASYENRIVLATQPLQHDGGSAGHIGLGYTFAERWIADNPGKNLILVPVGKGSTGLINTANWNQGDPQYVDMIDRVTAAMNYGTGTKTFEAILWHQGENDASQDIPTYEAALDQMIADMRTDIPGASASTPFILGNLVPDFSAPAMKASILDVPNRVSNTYYVETSDLDDGGDGIHFDAPSIRTMGNRYYDRFSSIGRDFSAIDFDTNDFS